MSTYNYYVIDCNRFKKRLREEKKSNAGLKLKLEATRAQFKDTSHHFKPKVVESSD